MVLYFDDTRKKYCENKNQISDWDKARLKNMQNGFLDFLRANI